MLGDGHARPSLLMQSPDLRMQPLPACLALHRTLLCGRGGLCGWWHRHRDHPIGQQHGLLALQGIDGIEGVRIRGEDLIQSFPQILQHMKAVRDLDGCGCPGVHPPHTHSTDPGR